MIRTWRFAVFRPWWHGDGLSKVHLVFFQLPFWSTLIKVTCSWEDIILSLALLPQLNSCCLCLKKETPWDFFHSTSAYKKQTWTRLIYLAHLPHFRPNIRLQVDGPQCAPPFPAQQGWLWIWFSPCLLPAFLDSWASAPMATYSLHSLLPVVYLGWEGCGLCGWLVGWLGGWVGGWVVGWLVGWVVGWLVGWLVGLCGWLVFFLFVCCSSNYCSCFPACCCHSLTSWAVSRMLLVTSGLVSFQIGAAVQGFYKFPPVFFCSARPPEKRKILHNFAKFSQPIILN